MNRIYIKLSTEQLKSADKGRCYLAYLLIRKAAKCQAGGFKLPFFLDAVQLKHRAGVNLLKKLVSAGFLRQEVAGNYRIVRHKEVAGATKGKLSFFSISDEQLSEFSLKRISYFRAFLVELEIERYKKHQRAKAKGYAVTNGRDGHREVIKNASLREWHQLCSNQCAADLSGVALSTACSYRRKQTVSQYTSKPIFYGATRTFKKSEGEELLSSAFKGKFFPHKGGLVFIPVATRTHAWRLKRG